MLPVTLMLEEDADAVASYQRLYELGQAELEVDLADRGAGRVSFHFVIGGAEGLDRGFVDEADEVLRTYGIGAQIIADLGIRKMGVLSAPWKLTGLAGFGLEVVEYLEALGGRKET